MIYRASCRATLIVVLLLLGCGPSQRRTYQSDNAFARCFDRDYNPEVNLVQKKNCWSNWLMSHQYNQPDDKTKYARLRLSEIADGVSIPGPPGPPGSFDQRPSIPANITAEAETDAGPKPMATDPPLPLPKSASCEASCRESFKSCADACHSAAPASSSPDGGVVNPCNKACEAGYQACMKACFQ